MSQKLENILNLALETDEETRAETENLNVGFDARTDTWELIVKYHGDLSELERAGVRTEPLIAGYAILTVPGGMVNQVAAAEQIEYAELPKRFWYSAAPPQGDCTLRVTAGEPYLTGDGVLIAVLDSGIDWKRDEFRNEDGSTRILALWDQTLGAKYTQADINAALALTDPVEQFRTLPSIDLSGHGTAVAGIAGGRSGSYAGVATGASFLIVKLGVATERGFPRTTEIMRGVTWALGKAAGYGMPLVINLSFGNCYGAHDGSSLLERFLDNASEIGRTAICVGSGNEGSAAGHAARSVRQGQTEEIELAIAAYEQRLTVQLWQDYSDVYRIYLRSPSGKEAELTLLVNDGDLAGKFTLRLDGCRILAYQGEPLPYTTVKELYLELLPTDAPYLTSGIWSFRLEPVRIVSGRVDLYLTDSAARNAGTMVYNPTAQTTLTIPSTASRVITVGAYNSTYQAYADFSGRGFAVTRDAEPVLPRGLVKPDLVAPGVDILALDLYGGYTAVSGTSFAAPIASGAAALLMEWGIVRGNDPYLYGEKLKAYLRAGAQPLRGEMQYPNDRVGYGRLCAAESLP